RRRDAGGALVWRRPGGEVPKRPQPRSLRKGLGDAARFVLGRLEYDLGLGILERVDAAALDVLPLHLEDARLRSLAVLAKAQVADDRLEALGADELRHLLVVERFRALDRVAEHLQIGVGEGRQIPAERVDPGACRLGLV